MMMMMKCLISFTSFLFVLLTTKCATKEISELKHESLEAPDSGGDEFELFMDSDFTTVGRVYSDTLSGPTWLKIHLENVQCVHQAVFYADADTVLFTFTCTPGEGCTCVESEDYKTYYCHKFSLKTNMEDALPEGQTSDCIYGDTVTVDSENPFGLAEIVLNGYEPGTACNI